MRAKKEIVEIESGMSEERKDAWVARPVRLEFLLGEIPLFVVNVRALEYDLHFTTLTTDLSATQPPFDRFSPEVEAIFIRSHPVSDEMPELEFGSKFIRYTSDQYQRYFVDLEGTFEDYLKGFSSKSRSTLQRKVRKFAEFRGGEIKWREYRNPDEMKEFYRLSREVSAKTYQERLLNLGLPENEGFQRDLWEMAAQDRARGYILFADQQPIAYLLCPVRDGVLFYRYLGYDPEFKNWSPGTVLQYLVLEHLFSQGSFRMFDFTDGEGPHKEFFSTGSVRCADLYYFRPTLRNRLLAGLHFGLRNVSGAMVRLLDRLGIKSRIKKLIRQWGYIGKLYFPGHKSLNQ